MDQSAGNRPSAPKPKLKLAVPENGTQSKGVEVFSEDVVQEVQWEKGLRGVGRATSYDAGLPAKVQRFEGSFLLRGKYNPMSSSITISPRDALDRELDDILALSRWESSHTFSDAEKKELIRALELTNHFIEHWGPGTFWGALVSKREFDSDHNKIKVVYDGKHDSDKRLRLRNRIGATPGYEPPRISYCFTNILPHSADSQMSDWPYSHTKAELQPTKTKDNKVSFYKGYNRWCYVIYLHEDLRTTLQALAQLPPNEKQQLRLSFRFFFMSLLCREIAYVLDHQCELREIYSKTPNKVNEKALARDNELENGLHTYWDYGVDVKVAVQRELFGGVIVPISRRCDTLHGLAVFPFDGQPARPIPMHYIRKTQIRDPVNWHPLTNFTSKYANWIGRWHVPSE